MAFGLGFSLPVYLGAGGPFAGATLVLDFTSGNQTLDPRITFTRSTTATRTNASGLIETVAINAPRFDYNPTTRAPNGLLIEEQRTNLQLRSQDFSTTWVTSNCALTVNVAVSPDGTVSGSKLVLNNGSAPSASRAAYQNIAGVTGVHTASIYAKAGEVATLQMSIANAAGTTVTGPSFNLTTGTFGSIASALSASITSVGNGWYRCVASFDFGAGASAGRVYYASSQATGDGISGIFIWGAQLEAGTFPTSYIPTVASQVTRTADVAVMTGTNFSSWYNTAESTLFAAYSLPFIYTSNPSTAFAIDDGTITNDITLRTNTSHTQYGLTFNAPGATGITNTVVGTFPAANVIAKQALAFVSGNSAQAGSGIVSATYTTTFSTPAPTLARLGTNRSSAALNGHIRSIVYYPRRLANTELQQITS